MKKTMSIVRKLRWMAAVSTLILIAVSAYMLLTQYQHNRRDREIATPRHAAPSLPPAAIDPPAEDDAIL